MADDEPTTPAAPAPEVGQIRTWTDRINQRRQGRVLVLDPDGVHVELSTAGGGIARVTIDMLDPLEAELTEEEKQAAREASVARARAWMEQTLATRLQDCVTGAWDALREMEPDADSDELKVRAGNVVRDAAQALADQLREHVAAKQSEAAAKEKP